MVVVRRADRGRDATADAELASTITTFLIQRISYLPVVEDGRCCGVLTTTDVMMAFQCGLFLLQRDSERATTKEAPAAIGT